MTPFCFPFSGSRRR